MNAAPETWSTKFYIVISNYHLIILETIMLVELVQNPRYQYAKLSNIAVEHLIKIYLNDQLSENLFKFSFELLQAKIQNYQKYKNVLLAYFDSGTYSAVKHG